MSPARPVSKVWLALLALFSALPLLLTPYPPLQDAAAHAGAIRVLSSISDPAFGISEHFVRTLDRTQYILYYLSGSLLAKVVSAELANRLLASIYLFATPFAIRSMLRAVERDERAALLAIPLLPNPLFMLGLFPFLLGVTVMFFGLAASLRFSRAPTLRGALAVSGAGVLLFFLHVVPLALLMITHLALSISRATLRRALARLIPLLPPMLLVSGWTLLTNAGHESVASMFHAEYPLSFAQKVADLFNWTGDVWRDLSDEALFVLLAALLTVIVMRGRTSIRAPIPIGYAVFPITCLLATALLGDHYAHIYPIWQRFPVLLLLGAILYVPWPDAQWGGHAEKAARALAIASISCTAFHFAAFQKEAREFDDVLDQVPARKKVAALVFDKRSEVGHTATYLHFASYYEARKGGLAAFTYAGYPHWPYAFLPGAAPTGWNGRAPHNWEWFPERANVETELAPFFDYLLVRGTSSKQLEPSFTRTWSGAQWQVWTRTTR